MSYRISKCFTFDPKVIALAEVAAARDGLPLSRWIEQMIRQKLSYVAVEEVDEWSDAARGA